MGANPKPTPPLSRPIRVPLTRQVQEALLHSQRMFRQRVERRERALLRASLTAWLQRR